MKKKPAEKTVPKIQIASKFVMWPIAKLIPYEGNSRTHSDKQIEKIAASIQKFGFNSAVRIDSEGGILAGHGTVKAAAQLGMDEVPVLVLEHLTATEKKAYVIADNKLSDLGGWDDEMLARELAALREANFDVEFTGFDPMEVDQLLHGVNDPEWNGMPEFDQDDLMPWQTLKVHFTKSSDRVQFLKLVKQKISENIKFIWYPEAKIGRTKGKRYESSEQATGDPRYPIYIISKGRWETRMTSKALEALKVPYHIVVEPQEYDQYAAVIDPTKIYTLPFSNLGQGSIPARNWVWEHAISQGAERHWIMDDNIRNFFRLNKNLKVKAKTGNIFCAAEDFVDRYTNVALAGFNYFLFAPRKTQMPPYVPNTRIYSNILIKNDIPYRWRGRYNEDTDLSIRVLKDKWCTIQFNAFLAEKMTTMTMKGGNTDELYKGEGRRKMAESLREQHPDVVTITKKWNRWQHQVDYRPFRGNKFIPKPGFIAPEGVDNYGMELMVEDLAKPEEKGATEAAPGA